MEQQKNFAVLIDADNVSPERFERIFGEISLWGNATYRRIYGNWAEYNRAALKEKLVEFGLTPVQQFNYIKGKNATDIALVIDAMDILYTGKVDGFAIVTNDSDFTRLALRLRESGMTVIGMGDDVAPVSFRSACTDFIVLRESRRIAEELSAQKTLRLVSRRSGRPASRSEEGGETAPAAVRSDNAPVPAAPAPRQILSDRELREDIKSILTDNVDNDGWLSASTLVNLLKARHEGLDIKDYEHLPLFAGKRKIWTTYFLSLGFCESMQKGPSNYQLRIRADERKKVLEERESRGAGSANADVKANASAPVNANSASEKVPANEAATAPAPAAQTERVPGHGRRRNRHGRKPAAENSQGEAEKAEKEKAEPAKAEVKAEAKAEEVKAEVKPEAKVPKAEAKTEDKPEAKAETRSEVKTPGAKPAKAKAPKTEAKAEAPKTEAKAEVKTEAPKAEANAKEAKAETQPEAQAETPKKPARRRKTAAKTAETKAETAAETAAEKAAASDKVPGQPAAVKAEKAGDGEAEAPKKTTRRRRTAAKAAAGDKPETSEKAEN